MTTNQDWEKVTQIYDDVIKLDESKQKDFVRKQCQGQQSILEQVMKMLEASNSQGFMGEYPGKINAENTRTRVLSSKPFRSNKPQIHKRNNFPRRKPL